MNEGLYFADPANLTTVRFDFNQAGCCVGADLSLGGSLRELIENVLTADGVDGEVTASSSRPPRVMSLPLLIDPDHGYTWPQIWAIYNALALEVDRDTNALVYIPPQAPSEKWVFDTKRGTLTGLEEGPSPRPSYARGTPVAPFVAVVKGTLRNTSPAVFL